MIKKIIQFGIPVIVAVLVAIFLVGGASGSALDFLFVIVFFGLGFIVFLIVGIVVRFITGDNFVIYSSLLSLAVVIVTFFIFNSILEIRRTQERKYSSKQVEIRLRNDLRKIEELSLQINQNPDNCILNILLIPFGTGLISYS